MSKNILVTGIVRNCEKTISNEYEILKRSLKSFSNVQYLIIESDSDDETVVVLKAIEKQNKNFTFISLGNLKKKLPKRTERITFCRNKYLEELAVNKLYTNIDYVLITDLDGTNELLDEKAILSCFENEDWDVCTCNQEGPYYDIWAFRHKYLSPNDCWKSNDFLINEVRMNVADAKQISVNSRMITIPKKSSFIEVDSAFGGAAIYKRETLTNAEYRGLDKDGEQICEHVVLHKLIREQGYKIYLNPRFINCTSSHGHEQFSKRILIKYIMLEFFPFFRGSRLIKYLQNR